MNMKRKISILLIIVAVVALACLLLWRWASSPVTTTIHTPEPIAQTPTPTTQPITTEYFTTTVPASHRVLANPSGQKSRVQIATHQPRANGEQLSIVSDVLPAEGLAGVGDYNMRVKTSTYQTYTDAALPEGAKGFRRTDGTKEITVFLVHGGRYATITASGNGLTETELKNLALKTTTDWQWL